MALPKLDVATFKTDLPSNGKSIFLRQFSVKEEKVLLTAKESDDVEEIANAIKQVLSNCIVTDGVRIEDLTMFDMEWLFIEIRKYSVNNIIELNLKNKEGKIVKKEVDLNDAKIDRENEKSNVIALNDTVSIKMKYPDFKTSVKMEKSNATITDYLYATIDSVIDGEEITKMNTVSKDEAAEFIESFTAKNMKDIKDFFAGIPKVYIDVELTDGETKRVEGIMNFFT